MGKTNKDLKSRLREMLEIENALWKHELIVGGVDEAGAGPLAGPVVAACVVLDPNNTSCLLGLDDSKKLSEDTREEFDEIIRNTCISFGLGISSVEEIDEINIRQAALLAMKRAVDEVQQHAPQPPNHLLVDARIVPEVGIPQTDIIRGDSRSACIAAASVLAKVARDRYMIEADATYPGYGFATHKGYGTKAHMDAIMELGISPIHRRTFSPIRQMLEESGV